ncbi:hypothetical protein MMC14_007197, partial [Varicellaria rhodocarpa]|nr:hypothetical protein [Varicellaria rhodocarpa]
KEARVVATQRFILALSDQQLVTGIAILVTLAIKRCETSSWNYILVLDLAWFSALTHMTTLIVLRDYLSKNPRTRLWRIIAMGCMLLLLVVFMTLQLFVNFVAFPAMPLQCQLISKSPLQDIGSDDIIWLVASILFWAVYFGSNLLAVFSNRRVTLLGWLDKIYWAKWKKRNKPDRVFALQRKVTEHSRGNSRISLRVELKCAFRYYQFIRAGFAQSFLWEIIWMLAIFGFSVGSISMDRWDPQSWADSPLIFQGGENALGFGQIVALFLIALPFLGLVEAFTGE